MTNKNTLYRHHVIIYKNVETFFSLAQTLIDCERIWHFNATLCTTVCHIHITLPSGLNCKKHRKNQSRENILCKCACMFYLSCNLLLLHTATLNCIIYKKFIALLCERFIYLLWFAEKVSIFKIFCGPLRFLHFVITLVNVEATNNTNNVVS